MANLSQVERILASKAPVREVAGQKYKGQPPVYAPIVNNVGMIIGHECVSKGIPFVRVSQP